MIVTSPGPCIVWWGRRASVAAMRKADTVSKHRIEGAVRKATGSVKEAAGKMTGDNKLRMKGAVEKTLGSVQNTAGKAEEKLGRALKH